MWHSQTNDQSVCTIGECGREHQGRPPAAPGFPPAPVAPPVPVLPPGHRPVHVVPAAHSLLTCPLHSILQEVVPPHSMVQPELPAHSAVQPPCGHLMSHLLSPLQERVEPVPMVTLQALPPPHVTWLFVPVLSVHVLVPSHVDVHPEPQLPAQVDCPSQVLVQPVPHVRSQLFFELQ